MTTLTLIISGQTFVISGEGLTVEVVGASQPETANEILGGVAGACSGIKRGENRTGTESETSGDSVERHATISHSSRRSSPETSTAGEAVPPLATSPATNSPSRAARGPRENAMNESATDMRASDHCHPAGSNSRITSPAKIQTLEQSIRLLRPGCRHPDNTALCGGNGRRLCRDCAIQSEAA